MPKEISPLTLRTEEKRLHELKRTKLEIAITLMAICADSKKNHLAFINWLLSSTLEQDE